MIVANDEGQMVLTATENGYGKRTPIAEYTMHGRNTMGMIAIATTERNGKVVAACLVDENDEVILLTKKGKLVRIPVCDIRICSDNAVFGQPEVGLGITPGFGGTQRLARLVGMGMAKQLVYSALNIKADEALRIGLVNAVYPQAELMENVMKLANKIAKNAPIAVRHCKKAINEGISKPINEAVAVEEKLFGDCFETHDQVEGMQCFLSREKPKPKAVFTNN